MIALKDRYEELVEQDPVKYEGKEAMVYLYLMFDSFEHAAIGKALGFYDVTHENLLKHFTESYKVGPTFFSTQSTALVKMPQSESVDEINRFCEAMISIRFEMDEIVNGEVNVDDSALKNAPHTLDMLTSDDWTFSYSRQKAAYPLNWIKKNKFWPSVRRVKDAFGDRNLICSCAPISEYA